MDELKKIEEEKQAKLLEIESCGKDLDAIKENITQADSDLLAIIDQQTLATSFLEEQKTIIAELNPQVEELKKTKSLLEPEVESMKKSLEQKYEIEQAVKEASDNLEIIGNETIKANNEKEVAENTLKDIEDEIEIKGTDLSNLKNDYSLKTDKLESDYQTREIELASEFETLSAPNIALKKENETLRVSGESIKATILPLTQRVDELNGMISGLELQYEEKKSVKEKELDDISVAQDSKQIELDKREGDLSLKETYFEEKRTNLKFIKIQLEKKTGQPINIEI